MTRRAWTPRPEEERGASEVAIRQVTWAAYAIPAVGLVLPFVVLAVVIWWVTR